MNAHIGRSQTVADALDPARAAALHAALGTDGEPPAKGSSLRHYWHSLYFWDAQPLDRLGPDGHNMLGNFIPDFGLAQRMWAGGSLIPRKPLLAGVPAARRTVIDDITAKEGRSGPLKFVTLRHEILQDGLAATEKQRLVYREPQKGSAPEPAPKAPSGGRQLAEYKFNEVTLFRFSALTFNSHRIHYDADYCRDIAGHRTCVVHGPLLAMLLASAAVEAGGEFSRFACRATATAYCGERIRLFASETAEGLVLWASGPDERLCMKAETKQ